MKVYEGKITGLISIIQNMASLALELLEDAVTSGYEFTKLIKKYHNLQIVSLYQTVCGWAMGKDIFDYPKTTYLIKRLIEMMGKKKGIILDFFAGSGTTGHAVLKLNKEDGGERQFILCTDNQDNNGTGLKIATDICFPRLKKVIEGYQTKEQEKINGLGSGLKYFKTDFVDAEPTDKNKRKMVSKSTEMLCLKEDCFEEVKNGTDFKIFKNSTDKHLGIIYDDDGIEPFKKEAKKLNKQFVVYVFSLDESAREEEFEDVKELVELKPIPAVILNVYKRIFK